MFWLLLSPRPNTRCRLLFSKATAAAVAAAPLMSSYCCICITPSRIQSKIIRQRLVRSSRSHHIRFNLHTTSTSAEYIYIPSTTTRYTAAAAAAGLLYTTAVLLLFLRCRSLLYLFHFPRGTKQSRPFAHNHEQRVGFCEYCSTARG